MSFNIQACNNVDKPVLQNTENTTIEKTETNDSKVGIDTATWKYGYDSDSDESKYMDAILITFIFFYGEEMGNSLWLLTGDLLDGGADESLYGFTHDGGQAIYKNGNIAIYEPGSNDNFYIWLTPEGLK